MVDGDGRIVVDLVTPIHEQALENRTEPEQADAVAGIEVGIIVVDVGVGARSTSPRSTRVTK